MSIVAETLEPQEEAPEFYLKEKQQEAVDAVNDPTVDTLVLIGAVGTGKTDVAAHVVISICDNFPRTYWPVFRQNKSTAAVSVIPSYLEMLYKMGFEDGVDYKFTDKPATITFPNKSRIIFPEADVTKDRQGRKIKGINATGNHIDEADELAEIMFTTATSRKGRRNEYGQPSISIVTMNPNDGPLKRKYYDPWHDPKKHGPLPKGVRVIEFGLEDSWQTPEDIAALLQNPEPWKQRYLFNNWDYVDEGDSLFKSRFFAAAKTEDLDGAARRASGYDVAWAMNGDRSVRALGFGLTLVDIKIVKDKGTEMLTSKQAKWLKEDCEENQVGYENCAVDGVGNGVGVLHSGVELGAEFLSFNSGAAASKDISLFPKAEGEEEKFPVTYDMLRSQMAHMLAIGLEKGIIKIHVGCPLINTLVKEALLHNCERSKTTFKVESKDHIKKRLGESPDIFDAVLMWLWAALRKHYVTEWATAADMA